MVGCRAGRAEGGAGCSEGAEQGARQGAWRVHDKARGGRAASVWRACGKASRHLSIHVSVRQGDAARGGGGNGT